MENPPGGARLQSGLRRAKGAPGKQRGFCRVKGAPKSKRGLRRAKWASRSKGGSKKPKGQVTNQQSWQRRGWHRVREAQMHDWGTRRGHGTQHPTVAPSRNKSIQGNAGTGTKRGSSVSGVGKGT